MLASRLTVAAKGVRCRAWEASSTERAPTTPRAKRQSRHAKEGRHGNGQQGLVDMAFAGRDGMGGARPALSQPESWLTSSLRCHTPPLATLFSPSPTAVSATSPDFEAVTLHP